MTNILEVLSGYASRFDGSEAFAAFLVLTLAAFFFWSTPRAWVSELLKQARKWTGKQAMAVFLSVVVLGFLGFAGISLMALTSDPSPVLIYIVVHEEGDVTRLIPGAQVTLVLREPMVKTTGDNGSVTFTIPSSELGKPLHVSARKAGYLSRLPLEIVPDSTGRVFIGLQEKDPLELDVTGEPVEGLEATILPVNDGFKVLSETRYLDLRDWREEQLGPVRLEKLVKARKTAPADAFYQTFSSVGKIDFHALDAEATSRMSAIRYFPETGGTKEEKNTYKVALDVSDKDVGDKFTMGVRATYETGYRDTEKEFLDTRISHRLGLMETRIRFPHDKPIKGEPRLIRADRDSGGEIVAMTTFENESLQPLRQRSDAQGSYTELHVFVSEPVLNSTYRIEWDW